MTATRALQGLKAYLTAFGDSWTVSLRDADSTKGYPLIVLTDTGAEEHEVLDNVYQVTVEVQLHSVPHADGASASATTTSSHDSLTDRLNCLLGDYDGLQTYLSQRPDLHCFNLWGNEMTTEIEDQRRVTRSEMTIVCANR